MPVLRVLVDASVLLRFLLPSKNPSRAVDLIVETALVGSFDLLLPNELLVEMIDKLATDAYLAARIGPRKAQTFTSILRRSATPLPPFSGSFPTLTRDPKEDYLLAYALRDRADYLVTGDRDLLDLAPGISTPRIVDAGAFVRELRDRGLVR